MSKFKSFYIRYIIVFMAIIWLSTLVSFSFSFKISSDFARKLFDDLLYTKVENIKEMNKKYSVSPEELSELMTEGTVKIRIYKSILELRNDTKIFEEISEDDVKSLDKGDTISIKAKRSLELPFLAFKMEDKIMIIGPNPNNNIMKLIISIILMVLFISSGIGSVLIVISLRFIIKPIKKLTFAMKEVAKGNFDIKINLNRQDEVGQLAEHFDIMTKELKKIEYLRKDFISNVSHEFKTPMTSIQGFAKLLKKQDLHKKSYKEYLDIIISETGRLSTLSTNLLNLTELENKSIIMKKEEFLIDEQIRKVILLLEKFWTQKNLEFILELEKTKYIGEEHLLWQIWLNLISNAIKFSNENSEILIKVKNANGSISIEITDNGIGMEEAERERIFEKFYKVDKSRSKDGNGLGLSIVKKIIDTCNGRIYVKSSIGKGTTFLIKLKSE
ncbi:MAG: HAMP domain-containing sensor histidine kinase [Clostridiales bacterium]